MSCRQQVYIACEKCIILSKESSFVMLSQSMCREKVTKIFIEKHPSSAVSCICTEWWKSTKQQVVADKKTYITTVCFDWWETGWYWSQNGTSSRKSLLQLTVYMATKLLKLGQYKINLGNSFNLSGEKKELVLQVLSRIGSKCICWFRNCFSQMKHGLC